MALRSSTSKVGIYTDTTISTINNSSSSVSTAKYLEAVILISVTAKTGTAPTLDLDVETSEDALVWHKLDDVPQINDPVVTTTFLHPAFRVTNMGKFIRLNNPAAPGGSASPSLTLSATVILKT